MDLIYKVVDNKYSSIKQALKEEFNISSRLYLRLKKTYNIFLNDKAISYDKFLSINDKIEIRLGFKEDNSNIKPTKMHLEVLYEDEYLLVLNKEPGFAVHPSLMHYETSLSNGVKYYFDSIGLQRKIRIVNRLDKDTSGIVIFAKNEYIQERLIHQMKNNIFKKEYIGILDGQLKSKKGTINAPIARKKR